MFTTAGAAVALAAFAPKAFAKWEPSERYPDPYVQVLDPAFNNLRLGLASVERLYHGTRWNEGPVYFGDACLLWATSENRSAWRKIPPHRIYRNPSNTQWQTPTSGPPSPASTPRAASRAPVDGSSRLPTSSTASRSILQLRGREIRRLDWFTILLRHPRQLRGHMRRRNFRPTLSADKSAISRRERRHHRAEGKRSPDESKLYVVEAALNPRVIQVFDVTDNGTKLANKRAFINAEPGGTPDGFRVDVDGNLWCGWGMGNEKQDGVKVFDNTGKPIGFIQLPERCANVCFGGPLRNRLFMAASHSVYSLYVNTQGAKGG